MDHADLPRLIDLITPTEFDRALRSEPWPHPLRLLWERRDGARDEELAALERGATLLEHTFRRSDPSARARLRGNLRRRETFGAAVAELICAARLEALGAVPRVADLRGGPDFECHLAGDRFFVEVYAPDSAPQETLVDDVAMRLMETGVHAHVNITIAESVARHTGFAKEVARQIRGQLHRCARSEVFPTHLTFHLPPNREPPDMVFRAGGESWLAECPIGGWIDCWGPAGPTMMVGMHGARVYDPKADAEHDLSDLAQLVPGSANVLVLDLTWRGVYRQPEWDAYLRQVEVAFSQHASLSAVLLTRRTAILKPAPSAEVQSTTTYRIVPSTNPAAANLARNTLVALETSGLLFPGP